MALSPDERARYQRHLSLEEVGVAGQEKLKAARVLVIGAGGLGSPSALYLAASGIGTLGIVDCDRVEVSNLQRQVLFDSDDVARPKAAVARERLLALNPGDRSRRPRPRAACRERARGARRLRRDPRRHGPPRHALPRQRRLRAARQAAGVGRDPPLRGAGDDLRAGSRALLPLPVRGRARGPGAQLRRRGCARRAARRARRRAGDRGHQARAPRGRAARRSPAGVRRTGAAVPRIRVRATRGLRGVRGSAEHHRAARSAAGVRRGDACAGAAPCAGRVACAARSGTRSS